MSVRERVEFILRQAKVSQSDFSAKSGYSNAVLSNFLTGKTDKPRIDLLEALKTVFPTLNLNWLITGQGDLWDGPAPVELKDFAVFESTSVSDSKQDLFNRLLVQKLQEMAEVLKETNPEAYRELGLEGLLGKSS